jgi:hypothetical protein
LENMSDMLFLLLVKAVASKPVLYNDIDKIYAGNKDMFFNEAKKTGSYDVRLFKENNLEVEVYCKKVLGILSFIDWSFVPVSDDYKNEIKTKVLTILKKGYKNLYKTLKSNHVITSDMIGNIFRTNWTNITEVAEIYSVLIVLSDYFKNELAREDGCLLTYERIFNSVKDEQSLPDANKVTPKKIRSEAKLGVYFKDFEKWLKYAYNGDFPHSLFSLFTHKFGYMDLSAPFIKFYESSSYFLEQDEAPYSAVESAYFSNNEIEDIIGSYVLHNFSEKDDGYELTEDDTQNFLDYFNTIIIIRAYAKEYVTAKKYFFSNSDIMADTEELKQVKKESALRLQKVTEQAGLLASKQASLNSLQQRFDKLSKNHEDLKDKLAATVASYQSENSMLLDALKAINNTVETFTASADDVKDLNVVVLSGHDAWQARLENLFPKFKFITADDNAFDINILDSSDYIVFNCTYASHGFFYKLSNYVRSKKRNIIYINNNNEKYLIQELYDAKVQSKK